MASSDDDSYEVIAEPTTGVDTFSFGTSSSFSETSDESWTNVSPSTQQRSHSSSSLVVSGAVPVLRSIDYHHQAQQHSEDDEESVDTQEFEKIKDDMISMFDTATIECHNPPDTLIWDPSAITSNTGSTLQEQDSGEEIQEKSAPSTVLQQPAVVDTSTGNYLPKEAATKCILLPESQDLVVPSPPSAEASDDGPISRVWGSPSGSALSSVFDPPHRILYNGGFEEALLHARESHRLLLVNLQQYPGFGCYAINRDIWRDELIQNLIEARFVFWQSTTDTRDATAYAQHFRVSLFPHVAVMNPNHRSHIWGIEGWSPEKPWTVIDIAQKLSEITFDRFTEEQLIMEVDEEPFIAEPMIDVSSEMELQTSILGGDHQDLWSAVNISEFYELQQVMLLTTTTEDHRMDTGS